MEIPRRPFLHLAGGAAAAFAFSNLAAALDYPKRPVRFVVAFFAGSLSDILARSIAPSLSKHLGQEVIVDDQPGAGGNLATNIVVRASPDGYTLLEATSANVWNAALYDTLNFDFIRDVAPVAGISRTPAVLTVTPSFPAKIVPEFISYAKANPGKINMASGGTGTSVHIAGELFKMMAGVDLVHVPYRGSAPALTDMISGQVHVMFDILTSSIQHIRSGALRPLAVTSATRSEALPDLPTVGDFLPGYEATAWYGIAAPKNTPSEIVDKLNKEINAGLADPRIKARFADLASNVIPGSPTDFGKLVEDEIEKWGKVVKFSGAKPG